jgi:hypothetical protein
MYHNQQNPNGNGYPPYPPTGPQQAPNGQYTALPPLNNPAPTGHNAYEFIMEPNSKRPGAFGGRGSGSFGKRIAVVAVLLLVIIIGMFVAFSAFKPKSSTPQLVAILQRQQEIIRIATAATNQINTQSTSNFVINTQLTVTTSQTQVATYLQEHGRKVKAKELALDQDAKTDTLLSNAQSAGNYDRILTSTLTTQLETYEGLLQDTYKTTVSTSTKQLMKKNFTAVEDLLDQAKSAQSATN